MTAAGLSATGVPVRIDELERLLGDPADDGNPVGYAAVLASDERGEMCAAGERVLDTYGLNAEFVPPEFGGRLNRLDHLIEVMRSVYRRDPCLGLGYGASSLIASVNVWTAADERQAATVAGLLLRNGKLACAYHELAHGNDMARTEFTALPGPGGLLLNGRKEVVTNIQRSDALVMFVRTDTRPGSRSHSQIYVDKSAVPAGTLRYLPRFSSVGMRGVQLGGAEFTDCPLPASAVLGTAGHGLGTAMRSFQLTRIVLPAMMTGIVDTGLRTTMDFLTRRRLYGGVAIDLPYLRAALAEVFVDLLAVEAFARTCARAVHLLPEQCSVYAAATKYTVAGVLLPAMNQLSLVLGARSYLRAGEHGIFQKMLRDLKPVGFGHAARAACQMTILPQLPLLANRSWSNLQLPPEALFDPAAELPPVPFSRLAVTARGADRLSAVLAAVETSGLDAVTARQLRGLLGWYTGQLRALSAASAVLPPAELTVAASAEAYDLTDRYIAVLHAAACVGVWLQHRRRDAGFLSEPAWLLAALRRIAARTGESPWDSDLPDALTGPLVSELRSRHTAGRSFGLTDRPLADIA
ncbi:acyl-CoA dehydrogenase [Micromonospora sp. NPDC051296]|uniref:acyl-CoA dehydrogenase n=1 Tax=Micromonospora sp. NPDC051296 TaxID=3155046 RepID=UPI003420FF21